VARYKPRWFTRPQTVTHPSTNRARCRVTPCATSKLSRHLHRHTQRIDCSTWTTKAVGKITVHEQDSTASHSLVSWPCSIRWSVPIERKEAVCSDSNGPTSTERIAFHPVAPPSDWLPSYHCNFLAGRTRSVGRIIYAVHYERRQNSLLVYLVTATSS